LAKSIAPSTLAAWLSIQPDKLNFTGQVILKEAHPSAGSVHKPLAQGINVGSSGRGDENL
jgi:hypothetical protein